MKRRYYIAALVFFSIFALPLISKCSNTDIWNLSGQGVYNAKDMIHVDNAYNLRLYNGSLFLGDTGLAPSVDNTQVTPSASVGGYAGVKVPIKYTGAVTVGDLICSSNVATGNGLRCPSTSISTIIGVADSTYAAGSVGWMTVGGYALVHATGTINIGDLLISSGTITPGYSGDGIGAANGVAFGKALSSNSGTGNVLAIISLQ